MRSPVTRLVVFAGLLVCSVAFSLGQASRVVVTRAGDDELRRTAYRLRVCPEQLQNARQALAEARALAPEVAGDVWLGDLGQLLNRFDREQAPALLAELLGQLSDQAGKAEDSRSYQQITSSAQMLLNLLREKNPDAAAEIVRTWPEARVEEPGRPFAEQVRKSLANEQFNALSYSDPVEALGRLPEYEGDRLDLQARSNLLQQLVSAGAEEEAGRLLDDSVAQSLEKGLDPNAGYSFGQLFSTAAWALPDRLPNMMSQLEAVLGSLPEQASRDVYVGAKKVSISARENLVLSIAQSLGNRPDTVSRLLNLAPGLRQKLEPLGGIDAALSPRAPAPPSTSRRIMSQWRTGAVSEASVARLEAPDANPQEFVELMQGARLLCERDPDRALVLLEQAGGILAKKGAVQALDSFQYLIITCLDCQGTLSPRIVELGNQLLTSIREEKKPRASPPQDPTAVGRDARFVQEQANRFEALLIATQAVEDFQHAMNLAAAHPDPRVRYQAYTQIAQQMAR